MRFSILRWLRQEFESFIQPLFALWRRGMRSRRRALARRCRRRPVLERLSSRCVLSTTYVVSDVTVPEGDVAEVTVSLSQSTDSALTLDYSTGALAEPATGVNVASDGIDYGSLGGTIVFEPGGPLNQTIYVQTTEDAGAETAEQFELRVSDDSGVSATGTVTIDDDDEGIRSGNGAGSGSGSGSGASSTLGADDAANSTAESASSAAASGNGTGSESDAGAIGRSVPQATGVGSSGSGSGVAGEGEGSLSAQFDVNDDGFVTPLDLKPA